MAASEIKVKILWDPQFEAIMDYAQANRDFGLAAAELDDLSECRAVNCGKGITIAAYPSDALLLFYEDWIRKKAECKRP